jgi:uncharacterized 2Fe-2S/4Fe-4S cluster protein (DUF4445 family)
LTLFISEDEILDVVPVGSPVLGLAYDIGTTTIACYFIDLERNPACPGQPLKTADHLRGDVIMR